MNREEALDVWAPSNSAWSRWTKAVLFSFMHSPIFDGPAAPKIAWMVPLLRDAALVLNLPGPSGVEFGLALAAVGYQPIPLYNACPYGIEEATSEAFPSIRDDHHGVTGSAVSVIDVIPIMRALETGTAALKHIALPQSAPPAFLIDSDRHNAAVKPEIGWFDNRSIIRQSDLPSAEFLKARGIVRIVVVQSSRRLQTDLTEVLLPWRDAGLSAFAQAPGEPWHPSMLNLPRPFFLKSVWDRALLRLRYRPTSSGAFGRFVHGSAG